MVPDRARAWAWPGAAALLTALVFAPAVTFPFLAWDDWANIAPASLGRIFLGSRLGHWQPATSLSLALDGAIWGFDSRGYHLTNVLLHALNAALVFLLARRLVGGPRDALPALFAALFWALHPLRVESVAWVTERRDVLCAALMLGCALAHERRRGKTALLLGSLAMTAKVFAVTLPALLLVLEAALGRRPDWRGKRAYLVPAAAALALNVAAQARDGAAVPLSAFGPGLRAAQAVFGLAFYPLKTLWPAGLSPLYERSWLLEPAPFLGAGLAALAAAGLLWRLRRRFPLLPLAALAYVLLLLPALGLFKSGRATAADRWSYLPAVPLSLLAGAVVAALRARLPRAAPLAAFAVLAALIVATLRYLPVWSSDVALWKRAREQEPLSHAARLRLAEALKFAGARSAADEARAEGAALHRELWLRAAEKRAARGDAEGAERARRAAAGGPFMADVP